MTEFCPKHLRETHSSSLMPKRGDHNAKRIEQNMRTKSKARIKMKYPVVKTTKPHMTTALERR